MIEKITEDELEFMECWNTPECFVECMFHDFDNLSAFSESEFGNLRPYQIPMLSHEHIIDDKVPGLNEKERLELKKGAGDVYNFGGRGYGKSLITFKLDIPMSAVHDDGMWCAFEGIDEKRIRSILDPVKMAFEFHPIISTWKFKCTYKPDIKFVCEKTYWRLNGVNMTLQGKDPGGQFFSLHVNKIFADEMSFETEEIKQKRIDAYSELGAIERFAGMTNFTKYSPAGQLFFDYDSRAKLVNLPQFVSPFFDENMNEKKIKEHGGSTGTIGYRIFVKGEIVEDGVSVFDMDRVRANYITKERIKRMELTKKDFDFFREILIVNRPSNAEQIMIFADIGESAPTEIVIIMKTRAEKMRYLYNLTLRGMTNIELEEIFKWLITKLKAEVVGLDNGDGTGRAITNKLEKELKIKITRYDGSGKIPVDYEYDENGQIVLNKNGEPTFKQEYMSEWAIQRLKFLLYENKIALPIDERFDVQFNSVVAIRSGNRTVYKCMATEDHLFDAFKVAAIGIWDNEFNPNSNQCVEPILLVGF